MFVIEFCRKGSRIGIKYGGGWFYLKMYFVVNVLFGWCDWIRWLYVNVVVCVLKVFRGGN